MSRRRVQAFQIVLSLALALTELSWQGERRDAGPKAEKELLVQQQQIWHFVDEKFLDAINIR
jgi:hypothetical protein